MATYRSRSAWWWPKTAPGSAAYQGAHRRRVYRLHRATSNDPPRAVAGGDVDTEVTSSAGHDDSPLPHQRCTDEDLITIRAQPAAHLVQVPTPASSSRTATSTGSPGPALTARAHLAGRKNPVTEPFSVAAQR